MSSKVKVTMKGFPPRVRTERMFDLLARRRPVEATTGKCRHKWEEVEIRGEDGEEAVATREAERVRACDKCGTIEWLQLEKVRTLARFGFTRDPAMKIVQKSFKTAYSKRIVLEDGCSTKAITVDQWTEGGDF